ncbi:MAG: alginate lyase family protein [Acidobacteriota bacterium]
MKVPVSVITLAALLSSLHAQSPAPRVFLLDPATLAAQKAHPDPAILKLATHSADLALKVAPVTVTTKPLTPPTGDKRDYMSLARYWWPNPDTPNHLPYVRHDGKVNPEINNIPDHELLNTTNESARALALGFYLTGNEAYAEHAAQLLRTFYLDPKTGMNPNLDFAQYVPGLNTGRDSGVLDGRSIAMLVDAIGLLATSKSWTAADSTAMTAWFTRYYHWLTTNTNALKEKATPNNHGSWYAAQTASVAMFLNKQDDAKKIAEGVRDQRIPSQFDSKGLQKYELVRTNSFSYSAFNLEALTELNAIVTPTGIDLFKPAKPNAPGLLTGIDALLPYDENHKWPHEEITAGKEDSLCPALLRAAAHTHDPKYTEAQPRFHCKASAYSLLEAANK